MRRIIVVLVAVLFGVSAQAQVYKPGFAPGFRPGFQFLNAAKLNLDFTQGSLPSGVAASNGANRTRTNSSGTLVTASAPRFDYAFLSPFGSLGILYEAQRTNLQVQSNAIASGFTGSQTVLTAGAATSPDGTNNAASAIATNNSGGHYAQTTTPFAVTAQPYEISEYFKRNGTTINTGALSLYNSGLTAFGRAEFDLSSGTITGTFNTGFTATGSTITNVGNGWYRVSLIVTPNGSGNAVVLFHVGSTAGYVGNNGDGFYVYGAQAAAGASVTTLIPTTTTSVTGSADTLSFTIPSSVSTLTYTFDDNSTQVISGVSSGAYTVPSTLNRQRIKNIVGQ